MRKCNRSILILTMFFIFLAITIGCDSRQTTFPTSSDADTTIETTTEASTDTTILSTSIPIPEDTYSYESCYMMIKEPQAPNYLSQTLKYYYNDNGINYYFAEGIDSETRDRFINTQKVLVSYLQSSHYIETFPAMTYYLFEDYPFRAQSQNHKVYFGVEDTASYKQILVTLQSLFGESLNFGLLFGISNRLALEFGWGTDFPDVSLQDILNFANGEENDVFLALEYPCFLTDYIGSSLQLIKAASIRLVSYLFENETFSSIVELLNVQKESQLLFDGEWIEIINQWLSAIGSATQLTPRNNAIAFSNGGINAPLVFHTIHAKYYLFQDYSESQIWDAEIDYFKSSFSTLLFAVTTVEAGMDDLDLVFKDPNLTYAPFTIVLCTYQQAFDAAGAYAYYYPPTHTTYNSSVMAITHEYLHYLTTPSWEYNWQYESIAIYYNLPSYFQTMASNHELENISNHHTDASIALREFLGRDFVSTDFPTYCDVVIVLNDLYDVNALNPFAMISITNYVKNTYGDATTIQIFLHQGTIGNEISLTWEGLINQWHQWLVDTYGMLI
ncbi:MAG: hypothetical protein WC296_06115 [Candidatus Izemoplasmatales bacterium]